jgi:hypothetical protein
MYKLPLSYRQYSLAFQTNHSVVLTVTDYVKTKLKQKNETVPNDRFVALVDAELQRRGYTKNEEVFTKLLNHKTDMYFEKQKKLQDGVNRATSTQKKSASYELLANINMNMIKILDILEGRV